MLPDKEMLSPCHSDWCTFIQKIFMQDGKELGISPKFCPAAKAEEIFLTENILETTFPEDLKSLLEATNGVSLMIDLADSQVDSGYLIWPIDMIREINLSFRNEEIYKDCFMPFGHLLFFADAGNGDQFAYPILNGETKSSKIYIWNHEDDSRVCIAPSLYEFIQFWVGGSIKC